MLKKLLLLILFLLPLPAFADDAPEVDPLALAGDAPDVTPDTGADKQQYDLLNPVPDDQMRPFSTDRPGKTHSALTVDAGHFQLESDFFNYTYDRYSPNQETTRVVSVATPILKAGLTNDIDLEAAFDLYNDTHVTARGGGGATNATASSSSAPAQSISGNSSGDVKGQGFGDTALGAKINVFGNDGGGTSSLALLPFVKIPTGVQTVSNGVTEYTLNAPYELQLDSLWALTLEPALGWLKNYNNTGHHGDYSFIVNISRPVIWKDVTAAAELASDYSSDPNITPRYTFDPSLQWLVTDNFQLDMGAYIGLNRAAPDLNPYVGVSYRY